MNKVLVVTIGVISLLAVSPVVAQTEPVKLDAQQPKITTVSAMRLRRGPTVSAEEILRLKLGTLVTAIARSANQETVAGKTDYWYQVNLAGGGSGWLFGGLLLDYVASQREKLLRQIIEQRLKAEGTEFGDREEIYNLAASAINQASDPSTRAEFELLKLLALANWATAFPDNLSDKSPYREWLRAHNSAVIHNEFAGGYNLRSELLWNLEAKHHTLPIAERIAWAAAQNAEPSDCEGDEVCHFNLHDGEIKYLNVHPVGAHAAEAVNNINEALTDEVIKMANGKGGDQYEVEQRNELRKTLASLRLALSKVTARQKSELLNKLDRITR